MRLQKARRRLAAWIYPESKGDVVVRLHPGGFIRGTDVQNIPGEAVFTQIMGIPSQLRSLTVNAPLVAAADAGCTVYEDGAHRCECRDFPPLSAQETQE